MKENYEILNGNIGKCTEMLKDTDYRLVPISKSCLLCTSSNPHAYVIYSNTTGSLIFGLLVFFRWVKGNCIGSIDCWKDFHNPEEREKFIVNTDKKKELIEYLDSKRAVIAEEIRQLCIKESKPIELHIEQ